MRFANTRDTRTVKPEDRFSKAPPGFSFTQSPGNYAWEKPPKYATPAEAMDAITENMGKMKNQMMHVKMLMAGISIEEIVNVTTKMGFMQGMWSVDVAEIIKVPFAWYLMGLAAEAGIDAKVLATKNGLPARTYDVSDSRFLTIMRDRNPELASFIQKEMPKRKLDMDKEKAAVHTPPNPEETSFLNTRPEDREENL